MFSTERTCVQNMCQYFCTTAADHPGTDFYSRDPANPAVNGHRSARTSYECIQRCSSDENEHFVSKIGGTIFPRSYKMACRVAPPFTPRPDSKIFTLV